MTSTERQFHKVVVHRTQVFEWYVEWPQASDATDVRQAALWEFDDLVNGEQDYPDDSYVEVIEAVPVPLSDVPSSYL